MMKRLQAICLFGAVYCCGYAVVESIAVLVGSTCVREFVWLYPALFSAGYGTAMLCVKPSVPILRAVLFIGLSGAALAAWRTALPYVDVLLVLGRLDISSMALALTVKGGLFFILGVLTRLENPIAEKFGWLWPGLLPVAGALLLAEWYPKAQILKNQMTVLAVLFILFAIFRQWLIQTRDIFTSRGIEIPEVRKRIMRTGIITAAGLFFFIIGTVALRKQIWSLACLLMDGIQAVIGFIIWLLGLLFRTRESVPVEEGFGFMPMDPRPSSYPWVVFLQYFLGSLAIISAFYWLLVKTGTSLRGLLLRLFAWLSGLFVRHADIPGTGEAEYYDTVEVCPELPEKRAAVKKQTLSDLLRLLKEEHDPVKLVRIVYRIFLVELCARKVESLYSDTTGEILKKAMARLGGPEECAAIKEITCLYDKTRYGEQTPLNRETEEIREKWGKGMLI